MNPTGEYSRYYCFDHQTDFETRMGAMRHLVQEHGQTPEQAVAKLNKIDEMYDDMDDYEDEVWGDEDPEE